MKKFNISSFIRKNPIILIFVLLFVCDSIAFPNFLTLESVGNLLRATCASGLIVIGMTLVILCSDIDLSVGSVLALSGIVFANLVTKSFTLAIIAALAVGFICGIVTGLLTVKAKLPPFIASLSTQYAIRGIVYIVTNQKAIKVRNAPEIFHSYGNGDIVPGLPVASILFIVIGIVMTFILEKTTFGRNIYATGSNMEAANMMGVKTDNVRMSAYVISGILAGLAGTVTTARLGAAQAVAGQDLEMTVIASVVLGGVLLRGGVGKMYNAMVGALFIRLLITTFNNIPTISTYWQTVITGVCLLGVVFFQNYVLTNHKKRAVR